MPEQIREQSGKIYTYQPCSLMAEANDARILLWKWKEKEEELFVFSSNMELYAPESYWLKFFPCFKMTAPDEVTVSLERFKPESARFSGKKYFFLSGRTHFGHWLGDFLPNLLFLKQHNFIKDSVIVTTKLSQWQKDTLHCMGIKNDILELDSSGNMGIFEFDKIFIPGPLPPAVRFAFLRKGFSEYAACVEPPSEVMPRKIYVSRRNFDKDSQRVINDEEISNFLSSKGFVTIYPENEGVFRSIHIFQNAEIVVCAPGSGHFNYFAFGSDLSALITLMPKSAFYNCPQDIVLGGWTYHIPFLDRSIFVLGKVSPSSKGHAFNASATYSIADLEKAIEAAERMHADLRNKPRSLPMTEPLPLPSASAGAPTEKIPAWKAMRVPHRNYVDNPNVALLRLMGRRPRLIFDVGCNTGANSFAIKKQFPDVKAIGIEPRAHAADIARLRLDQVHCMPLEQFDFIGNEIKEGDIDTLILSDVLEHMFDPWEALERLHPYLSSDAQILSAIPNVRSFGVLRSLMAGEWPYEESGVLDITHLRFFTQSSMRKMFMETGYEISCVALNIDPEHRKIIDSLEEGKTADVAFQKFTIRNVTRGEAMELAAYQFLVLAKPIK